MIIGLTGSKASGKGAVADILKEIGFEYSSTSDRVREEAVSCGLINYVIKDLQDIGNELRQTFGNGILAKRTLEKLQGAKNCVVDGIRNIGEIEELKKENATIIAVDAPQKTRYQRLISRGRESDPKTWEGFLEMDKRDQGIGEENSGQQVKKCIELANHLIMNDADLKGLEKKVKTILSAIMPITKRTDYISWDEYFMGIAFLSAQRSKDPNTQVGACIVTPDKKIIGTGYNGFPIGCSDDELPWAREGDFLDTKYAYVCHAELNAILNSTKKPEGCSIYVDLFPCNECAKAIIQSGIKEIIYRSDKYAETDSHKASRIMLDMAGIDQRKFSPKESFIEY